MQSNYGIRRDCEYLSKDGHHGGKTLRYDVLPLLHDVHVQIRVLVKMYSNAVTRCWSWSIKGALQIPITFKFVHGKWFWYQLEESSYFVQLPQPIFTLLHDVQDNGIGENVFMYSFVVEDKGIKGTYVTSHNKRYLTCLYLDNYEIFAESTRVSN